MAVTWIKALCDHTFTCGSGREPICGCFLFMYHVTLWKGNFLTCLVMNYLPFKALSVSVETSCSVESSFSYMWIHMDVKLSVTIQWSFIWTIRIVTVSEVVLWEFLFEQFKFITFLVLYSEWHFHHALHCSPSVEQLLSWLHHQSSLTLWWSVDMVRIDWPY